MINRENFVWLVDRLHNAWPFKCVVIDENRGFKDRASQSWKALKKIRPQVRKLFIMTGTPTPNSLLELWPQISILDQGKRLGTGITKGLGAGANPEIGKQAALEDTDRILEALDRALSY